MNPVEALGTLKGLRRSLRAGEPTDMDRLFRALSAIEAEVGSMRVTLAHVDDIEDTPPTTEPPELRCKECGSVRSAPEHDLEAVLDPGTVAEEVHVFFPSTTEPLSTRLRSGAVEEIKSALEAALDTAEDVVLGRQMRRALDALAVLAAEYASQDDVVAQEDRNA